MTRLKMIANEVTNLTDSQQEYYNGLPNEEQKAAFLQMMRDSLGPLNTTITDLSGERESQTTTSTLTVSCMSNLGEKKGGSFFYKKVFRTFKFVSQEQEIFKSTFCKAVFEWMNEEEDAKTWVKLKKFGMSAVSDARTQLQNRVKDFFIRKWNNAT